MSWAFEPIVQQDQGAFINDKMQIHKKGSISVNFTQESTSIWVSTRIYEQQVDAGRPLYWEFFFIFLYFCAFSSFLPFVMEKDVKILKKTISTRTVCKAPVCCSKYTTHSIYLLSFFQLLLTFLIIVLIILFIVGLSDSP